MQFEVFFLAKGDYAVSHQRPSLGTDHVDEIRRVAGCNLMLDRIVGFCWICKRNPNVPVPEAVARRSGLFRRKSEITVLVPPASLDKYVRLVPTFAKDDGSGEILEARMADKFDNDAILKDWEAAGFPLKWDPEGENES